MNNFRTLFVTFVFACTHLIGYEVAIVTMFQNEAPYMKEWIEYHRMIGVDHFWMYNDRSDDNFEEVLAPYINEGLVEVIDWPTPAGTKWYLHQHVVFEDGLRRAQGVAKWVAAIDMDEFILPMMDRSIPECLEKRFPDASAIYMSWRCFGSGGVDVPLSEPFLFQLDSCSLRNHARNGTGKSLIRPDSVILSDIRTHHRFPLKKGCQYVTGDGRPVISKEVAQPYHFDQFIRINHYSIRDESYYQKKLKKARDGGYADTARSMQEWHVSFSKTKDRALMAFIMEHYPLEYDTIWKR